MDWAYNSRYERKEKEDDIHGVSHLIICQPSSGRQTAGMNGPASATSSCICVQFKLPTQLLVHLVDDGNEATFSCDLRVYSDNLCQYCLASSSRLGPFSHL